MTGRNGEPTPGAPLTLAAHVAWTGVGGRLPHTIAVPRTIDVTVHGGWRAANGAVYLRLAFDGGDTAYESAPGRPVFSWSYLACGFIDAAMQLEPGETRKIGSRRLTRLSEAELLALAPLTIGR